MCLKNALRLMFFLNNFYGILYDNPLLQWRENANFAGNKNTIKL